MDITIVEILKKDKIGEECFLLPNIQYKNGYDFFKGKEIVIPQFPHGGQLTCSSGIIKNINLYKYEFSHLASTEPSSSGSPLFLKRNDKVLGIHKQTNEKKVENYGNFIEPIINSLETDVEIREEISNEGIYKGEFKFNAKEGNRKFTFFEHKLY